MPRNEKLNEQMRSESREKILTAARRLFAHRGFDGCNVADIAREAGMSQGNVYWYFPSKQAVLAAVLADGFEKVGRMMAGVSTDSASGTAKLDQLIDGFLTLAGDEDGDAFITIVVNQIGQGGVGRLGELGSDAVELGTDYTRVVSDIIAEAQREGGLDDAADPALLTVWFFSFLNGLMYMYPREWRDIAPEQIRAALLRLLGGAAS